MTFSKDIGDEIMKKVEEALKSRGRANILIAGKTGVGKSTLINAVFQGNLATTGQGKPVTKHFKEISKKEIPVRIIDTRGIEIEKHKQIHDELVDLIRERNQHEDPNHHIHAAWLCIQEDTRRIEDAEIKLADTLSQFFPVVAVITKARNDDGFKAIVEREVYSVANTIRVRAKKEDLDDGHTLEPMGLLDLVELTSELIPEGQEKAFIAAQKVSIGKKASKAHTIVAGSAVTAIGIGATPIPFSDAVLLAPVQIGMLAGISAVFGLKFDKAFLGTLISGTLSGVGGTLGGRAIVTGIMKMIPGVNIAGSAIAGATAGILTTTFGEAYIAVLKSMIEEKGIEGIDPSELAKRLKAKMKRDKKK